MTTGPLDGLRVLEVATEIAGPYAGKLLIDAGADVVKVEPPNGDPLRRWRASSGEVYGDGVLFRYLNASKRSVVGALEPVLAAADIVLVDAATSTEVADRMRADHPHLVVASITPFGRTGPWAEAGVPATEFTLQAMCGSTGGRGLPEGSPLYAGGRLGEWIGGAYAAVGALAASRTSRRTGIGEDVDVSLLECMASTMGGLFVVVPQLLGSPGHLGRRHLETPSIEPTKDGYVGFCTITAQQFQDFLRLIGAVDWADDASWANVGKRVRRRVEFLQRVHAWTTQHTTAEIIERASAMRIPVAPVGSPETLTEIDHFVERKVFMPGGDGTFVQPRRPYRIDDDSGPPFAPAPELGEHTGRIEWEPRAEVTAGRSDALPLDGVRVMDFTSFWAGPSGTLLLAALGADVVKVEGLGRPDNMRFSAGKPPSEDGWWEWGALYLAVNENKRGVTLELSTDAGRKLAEQLIAQSDVVMENFSTRVMPQLGLGWDRVHATNPRALMVRMPAFGLDGPWGHRVGFAQTMEQVSGMAWVTGENGGPPVIPRGVCDPIVGVHAAFATLVALEQRERTGQGALVEVPMIESALNVAAEVVLEYSAYGASLTRNGNRGPVARPQGVYRCVGDDEWVAIAARDDAQWAGLTALVGSCDRDDHDDADNAITTWTSARSQAEAVEALWGQGVPAAAVVVPAQLVENPQLASSGWFEAVDHPIVGSHPMPSLPFRFRARDRGWLRTAAPTMGQHNREVLAGLLGLTDEQIAALADAGVVGTRPAGL